MQTYSPIELMVVDDGSTDETAAVVERWISRHQVRNASCLRMPSNVGKSAAVNCALDRVHGAFVMIFDSDDILLPHAIATEVAFLTAHASVGMVCAQVYRLEDGVKTDRTFNHFQGFGSFDDVKKVHGDLLLNGNVVISSSALLRQEVVEHIGKLDTRLRYTHDWEYWIRVAREFKIGFIAEPLLYYRVNSSGASSLNRLGTFLESCELLWRNRQSYRTLSLVNAQLYQTKYNAWLAYHDPAIKQMLLIVLHGVVASAKLLAGKIVR